MSANISDWLLEGINPANLETSDDIVVFADVSTYYDYRAYNDVYLNYSVYYDYYNYSVYYDYYDYYNYSNSISVTTHPISQTVLSNETVSFVVRASNTIDSCQWYVADSATGEGSLIAGANSPTYTLVATPSLDDKYYYCIVRRGSNSSTSSRALLTVRALTVYDIYLSVNSRVHMIFVKASPVSTQITNISVSDTSIATVVDDVYLTGISIGQTTCTITGSNGLTATFNITVIEDPLVAVLINTAVAIREYRSITYRIYPNQMASILRTGDRTSINYNTLQELFTDIANAIRENSGDTNSIDPYDFYYEILSLMN